ncbi:YgiT-type zinc finger protein [Candidatus Woesearchaeota archaeon]|nr:YgiT-type zinc finger protein [Candidatus Woesearchaeota archaeon]
MKCVMCGGTTERKTAEYREQGVLLGKYPADVCTKCGEAYYDSATARVIQQQSRSKGLHGSAEKATVGEVGNSLAVRIPKSIAQIVGLKKGQTVTVMPHGERELHIDV